MKQKRQFVLLLKSRQLLPDTDQQMEAKVEVEGIIGCVTGAECEKV